MCLPALHTASVLCLVVLFCWLLLLVLFGSWKQKQQMLPELI
jgi:hypothetical protein